MVFLLDESLLKMQYLTVVDIKKNGLTTNGIVDRFIRSLKCFLKNEYQDYKLFLVESILLDMSEKYIIIIM